MIPKQGCVIMLAVADTLTKLERSERMGRVRGVDTGPEITVRRLVHKLGFRFRLHGKDLPGRPDLVFPRLRSVIFVHGCFWHRHPNPSCKLARLPKSRVDFWKPKLTANRQRDLRNEAALMTAGWRVLIVWECELKDKEQLENKLREFLGEACARSNYLREPADSVSA